jgi:hypothetical protein
MGKLGWRILAALLGLWVGVVLTAYFFLDWTLLIPLASLSLGSILLVVAVVAYSDAR